MEKVTVSRDKVVRASEMEPVFEAGNVHLLKGSWNKLFMEQFSRFPMGRHDDLVDAVGGGWRMAGRWAGPGDLKLATGRDFESFRKGADW